MNKRILPSRKIHVILAVVVVLMLAGSLGVRLVAKPDRDAGEGPSRSVAASDENTVPAPRAFSMAELEVPRWFHRSSNEWSVQFKTDLDLLAPLGNGERNAGEWFVDFRKPDGPRYSEARAVMERRVEVGNDLGKVLPANDPLLLEAEPWCDQASMRFYPDLMSPNGWNTQLPNLLVPLTFARSWVARGLESPDPEQGMEDCRRAIRLGRLLRQEDAVIITDLVGLACIRIGAEGIFRIAVKQGDAELALLASIVIGEVAPQRLQTSERITRSWDKSFLRKDEAGNVRLDIPDEKLDTILEMARNQPDQRFRLEPILTLNLARFMGTESQKERATELLTELSDLENPVISQTARWSLENEPGPDLYDDLK